MNADPAPPERGEGDAGMNTWTMKLTLDGKPPPDAGVTVSTFMPDHNHSSRDVPKLTSNADGTYTVSDLYLFMGGVWKITFAPAQDLDPADAASFWFCVED